MFQRLLFQISKSPWMGRVIGTFFQYGSWTVPVKRVINRKDVFVFYHPQPAYKNHIILSPKSPIRNLQQMSAQNLSSFFEKIWAAAMETAAKQPGMFDSFALVANGGKRQEVQQVHFHMFTNYPMVNETADEANDASAFYRDEAICIWQHPYPEWDIHFVLKPAASSQSVYFKSVLHSIDMLNDQFNIVQKGYSLVYQHSPQMKEREMPVFHIVSGKKHA